MWGTWLLRWYLVVAVAALRYTVAGDWYLFGTVGETVLLCSAICHDADVAEEVQNCILWCNPGSFRAWDLMQN